MELFENNEMRYLGWKQPYASLMLHGKIETRTWDTKYRGLVLITASKQFYPESKVMEISGEKQTQAAFVKLLENGTKEPRGKAIAVGRLVDSRLMTKVDEDKCFVKYREPWIEERKSKITGKTKTVTVKLWCHIYEDVRPIEPIEMKGGQGWRKLTPEFIKTIKYL